MRLLIAGWQGQIARAITDLALVRSDIAALSIGRPALDLCTQSSIRNALADTEPDLMINTAAYTAVDQAELEPDDAFSLNCDGAAMFAAAAAKRGIPVIHLSTDYVFDGTKQGPYREVDQPAPRSVYGRSKLAGESAVAEANPWHIILRTGWIYSSYGSNFVNKILSRAREGARLDVVNDQVGCPTYAPHLATAILEIATQIIADTNLARWGIYHAACNGSTSWYSFAKQVLEVSRELGGPWIELGSITSREYPTSAPRLVNSSLDCSKLENVFGIRMPHWSEGLRECIRKILSSDFDQGQ